jgi:hypothetical protein
VSPGPPLGQTLWATPAPEPTSYEVNGNTIDVEIVSVGAA